MLQRLDRDEGDDDNGVGHDDDDDADSDVGDDDDDDDHDHDEKVTQSPPVTRRAAGSQTSGGTAGPLNCIESFNDFCKKYYHHDCDQLSMFNDYDQ